MALSADLPLSSDIRATLGDPVALSRPAKSSAVLYHNALLGLYLSGASAGLVAPYDDADLDMVFAGLHVGDAFTGDGTTLAKIHAGRQRIDRVTVAGSASSKPGDPVFALSDDLRDLSVVGAGGEIVANLFEQISGTTWNIITVDAHEAMLNPTLARKIGPANAAVATADGAITLPSKNFARQVLTGASSAQMTLAAPSTVPIGYIFEIVRSGGSGTHDVDYTDQDGGAATAVLEAGQRIVLQVYSAARWRRLV